MNKYNETEKQQIMLNSDLLEGSLSADERRLLREIDFKHIINEEQLLACNIHNNLKNKITNLLDQGVKLGIELEKLAQRGIKIKFKANPAIPENVISKFIEIPNIFFIIGNESLLNNKEIKIVTSYSEFKNVNKKVIFITDRKFDTLLGYSDVTNRLIDGSLLLISDVYRSKSNLKQNERLEKKDKKIKSKKVFISGSRSQKEIPLSVQKSLDLIRKQNIKVLIGDSEKGVDNEIIDYLRLPPKYTSVKVYTINKKPRVKVEDEWETKIIQSDSALKPQEKQMVKDRAMADEADWGLAIFRPITKNRYGAIQVSSGTLRNTIQMLLNNKAVKFFYVINNKILVDNLKTIKDLNMILDKYKSEVLSGDEKEEILSAKGVKLNVEPALIKYDKIIKKFEELLKSEQIKSNIDNKVSAKQEEQTEQIPLFTQTGGVHKNL